MEKARAVTRFTSMPVGAEVINWCLDRLGVAMTGNVDQLLQARYFRFIKPFGVAAYVAFHAANLRVGRVLMRNLLWFENNVAELGTKSGGVHVGVAAISDNGKNTEHGAADENKDKEQFAHPAEALRIG